MGFPCSALDLPQEAAGLRSCVESPPQPVLPPFASQLAAEINEKETRVSAGIKAGDLSVDCLAYMDKRIGLRRFRVTHPVLSFGSVERGDFLRLICKPGGSWDRAPATSVARTANAKAGAAAPDRYGIVLTPFPGALSLFSFFEPEITSAGALAGFSADSVSADLLAVLSKPAAPHLPDGWLLEQQPAGGGPFLHGLLRLSVKHGTSSLSGGIALSSSRYTTPQLAASSTLGVVLPGVVLFATVSGATRGYFDIRGKPAKVPLFFSYTLSTGSGFPVYLFLRHEIEIEKVPLVRIPFRAADESLRIGFEAEAGPLSFGAGGEARIRTDRTAMQELSAGAGADVGLAFPSGRVALSWSGSKSTGGPWGWGLRLPVKLEAGDCALSTEAVLSIRETARLGLSAELRGKTRSEASWYIAAGAVTRFADGRSISETLVNPEKAGGPFAGVDFSYRIGWRAKS